MNVKIPKVFFCCWWACKIVQHLWKRVCQFLHKKTKHALNTQPSSHTRIFPEKGKLQPRKSLSRTSTAALFRIADNCQQPHVSQWVAGTTHRIPCQGPLRSSGKEELVIHNNLGGPDGTPLRGGRESQKATCCVIPFIYLISQKNPKLSEQSDSQGSRGEWGDRVGMWWRRP